MRAYSQDLCDRIINRVSPVLTRKDQLNLAMLRKGDDV
jgi:hypothetical protein